MPHRKNNSWVPNRSNEASFFLLFYGEKKKKLSWKIFQRQTLPHWHGQEACSAFMRRWGFYVSQRSCRAACSMVQIACWRADSDLAGRNCEMLLCLNWRLSQRYTDAFLLVCFEVVTILVHKYKHFWGTIYLLCKTYSQEQCEISAVLNDASLDK